MNYTEYLQSLRDPLYEAGGIPKCPEGYRFDKKTMRCVPKTESDRIDDKESSGTPDAYDGFNVWGSSGMDGGYALETEEWKEFPIDKVKKQINEKRKKGGIKNEDDVLQMKSVARDEGHHISDDIKVK